MYIFRLRKTKLWGDKSRVTAGNLIPQKWLIKGGKGPFWKQQACAGLKPWDGRGRDRQEEGRVWKCNRNINEAQTISNMLNGIVDAFFWSPPGTTESILSNWKKGNNNVDGIQNKNLFSSKMLFVRQTIIPSFWLHKGGSFSFFLLSQIILQVRVFECIRATSVVYLERTCRGSILEHAPSSALHPFIRSASTLQLDGRSKHPACPGSASGFPPGWTCPQRGNAAVIYQTHSSF